MSKLSSDANIKLFSVISQHKPLKRRLTERTQDQNSSTN